MINHGDKVRLITKDGESFEGIYIDTPELSGKDFITLKLSSGYNIGISKKEISSLDLIKKNIPPEEKTQVIKKKKDLPSISLLSTGGTISCKVDYRTGGVNPKITAQDFINNVPEITKYANINAKQVMQIPSENLTVKDWQKLAREIYKEIKKGTDGIVVTMGTDTLHYSATAISFMLKNLNVPIVFVGAQRSVDRGSSDAYPNLLSAVMTASKWDGAEVIICMHKTTNDGLNMLIRGVKARKMHTERRDAFRPINDLPLAFIDYERGLITPKSNYRKRSKELPKLEIEMDEKVGLIYIYPNMKQDVLQHFIDNDYHGIILAGTGFGHVPTGPSNSLLPVLKRFNNKGIPVIMTSQCLYGRTNPYVYSPLRQLSMEAKVIFAEDMLPEVAYIKLMHILGKTKDLEEIKKLMLTNMVGEINPLSQVNSFLI